MFKQAAEYCKIEIYILDIFLARNESEIKKNKLTPQLSLGGTTYWFLRRYFVHADLDHGKYPFLDLYEDTELAGYHLQRLKTELEEALLDISARPTVFKVLLGWAGSEKTHAAEEWKEINRQEVTKTIQQFLALIDEALKKNLMLLAVGD